MAFPRYCLTVTVLTLAAFLAACDDTSTPVPIAAALDKSPTLTAEGAADLPPCCAAEGPNQTVARAGAEPTDELAKPQVPPAALTDAKPVQSQVPADGEVNASTFRASDWLDPAQRDEQYDLDWNMTDHEGRAVNLQSLVGRPVAVSFIYTRCPNPKMCPLTATRMADLERRLAEAGLSDKVQLWLISFDPTYDTPGRLKAFAQGRGVKFSSVRLFRPQEKELEQLKFEFGVNAVRQADGSIAHYTDLFLIDRQGRFVRYYAGGGWDNTKVVIDLTRLAGENNSSAQKPDALGG